MRMLSCNGLHSARGVGIVGDREGASDVSRFVNMSIGIWMQLMRRYNRQLAEIARTDFDAVWAAKLPGSILEYAELISGNLLPGERDNAE